MDDEHTYIPSPRSAQAPSASVRPAPAYPAPAPPTPVHRPGSDGEHQIQQHLETTKRADRFYNDQMLDHLNERMREFVGLQEMFFLATADRNGECDSTFRAGPPGFLRVLDERTLVFPEYRGNGVHASLGNIQENPHLGIMIIDFLRARIGLHINGEAEIIADADIRAQHPDLPTESVPGRKAKLWVKVTVEEAYIHCAKHIPHLQRAPKGAARDWGTDDYRRKGGDFFGVARDRKTAREAHTGSPSAEPTSATPATPTSVAPAPAASARPAPPPAVPVPPAHAMAVPAAPPEASASTAESPQPVPDWRSEALRVLAEAEARGRAWELASVSARSEAGGTSSDAESGESAGAPAVHSWFGGRV